MIYVFCIVPIIGTTSSPSRLYKISTPARSDPPRKNVSIPLKIAIFAQQKCAACVGIICVH